MDISLLTCDALLENPNNTLYNEHVLLEEKILSESFNTHGLKTNRISWSDANNTSLHSKKVIFRSTWDYMDKPEAFKKFIQHLGNKSINNHALIGWNLDKNYLQELHAKGIQIPKSYWIPKNTPTDLKALYEKNKWDNAVIKPSVSAGGSDTFLIEKEALPLFFGTFNTLNQSKTMIVQQYFSEIKTLGEISLVFIAGKFTHGVIKTPQNGEFRVQDDYGGKVQPYTPSDLETLFGYTVIKACPLLPDYARVDYILTTNGPTLMELELIEPELWFRHNQKASDLLAKHIKEKYF